MAPGKKLKSLKLVQEACQNKDLLPPRTRKAPMKLSPELRARRNSTRLAIKRVFKPRKLVTSASNPIDVSTTSDLMLQPIKHVNPQASDLQSSQSALHASIDAPVQPSDLRVSRQTPATPLQNSPPAHPTQIPPSPSSMVCKDLIPQQKSNALAAARPVSAAPARSVPRVPARHVPIAPTPARPVPAASARPLPTTPAGSVPKAPTLARPVPGCGLVSMCQPSNSFPMRPAQHSSSHSASHRRHDQPPSPPPFPDQPSSAPPFHDQPPSPPPFPDFSQGSPGVEGQSQSSSQVDIWTEHLMFDYEEPVPENPKSVRIKSGDDPENSKRHRRGLVIGLKLECHCVTINGRVKVETSDGKNPSNKNVRSLLVHDIGAFIKDSMPMIAETFSKLPKAARDLLPEHLSAHFILPPNEEWLWDFIWRSAARRYSDWKCHCHTFFKEEQGQLPSEFLWRPKQWQWLSNHFKTPKFQKKSEHMANIRYKNGRMTHHLGKTPLHLKADEFTKLKHKAPRIAAFEQAYFADPNGRQIVANVMERMHQLLEEREIHDPGAVDDPLDDEHQLAVIDEAIAKYKGKDPAMTKGKRKRPGPSYMEIKAQLEQTKEKEAAAEAREAEARAKLVEVEGRLKIIEDMIRGTGAATCSDGASFMNPNLVNLG